MAGRESPAEGSAGGEINPGRNVVTMSDPVHATKIEYRVAAVGAGDYTVLADESDATLAAKISGYQPKLTKAPYEAPGYGAPGITALDMGNQKWALGFGVARVHADEGAAVAFIATHAAAIGAIGNVDLKITTYVGVVYLVNAALVEFTPDPASDKSSFIHYGFVSGSYTGTAP